MRRVRVETGVGWVPGLIVAAERPDSAGERGRGELFAVPVVEALLEGDGGPLKFALGEK